MSKILNNKDKPLTYENHRKYLHNQIFHQFFLKKQCKLYKKFFMIFI
jgi:hypothetical protein